MSNIIQSVKDGLAKIDSEFDLPVIATQATKLVEGFSPKAAEAAMAFIDKAGPNLLSELHRLLGAVETVAPLVAFVAGLLGRPDIAAVASAVGSDAKALDAAEASAQGPQP